MASEHGVKVTEAAVRDRLKYLAEHNYMIGNDLHGYEVTEQAVKRFGFAQKGEALIAPVKVMRSS